MKVGDLIEARRGEIGVVIGTEMMYPGHPDSPVSRVKVKWQGDPPRWCHNDLLFSTMAINRVLSRANW